MSLFRYSRSGQERVRQTQVIVSDSKRLGQIDDELAIAFDVGSDIGCDLLDVLTAHGLPLGYQAFEDTG